MQRIISKRSSSSVDLDSSSLEDVRTERAAISLSEGLSWPPAKRRRSAGRPTWRQLWERALQEHILHHHELPHGVRLQRLGWWQPGDANARPLTHEEIAHVSTRAAPAAPTAALVEDEPSGSGTKRRKIRVDPTVRDWFPDVMDQWRTERRWGMQQCDGVKPNTPYRWKRSAPALTRRRDTAQHLSAVTIRGLVLRWLDAERLDVRPSQSWVQRLLCGMRLRYKKPTRTGSSSSCGGS